MGLPVWLTYHPVTCGCQRPLSCLTQALRQLAGLLCSHSCLRLNTERGVKSVSREVLTLHACDLGHTFTPQPQHDRLDNHHHSQHSLHPPPSSPPCRLLLSSLAYQPVVVTCSTYWLAAPVASCTAGPALNWCVGVGCVCVCVFVWVGGWVCTGVYGCGRGGDSTAWYFGW